MDVQLKRGLLDVCVLAAIKNEDSYGYKIIKDMKPYIELSESTLYTILKRLEAANMLNPKNLFPIHYFEMDWKKLARGLKPGISLYVDGVHCTDIQQK